MAYGAADVRFPREAILRATPKSVHLEILIEKPAKMFRIKLKAMVTIFSQSREGTIFDKA
jgi:hypothetical protein